MRSNLGKKTAGIAVLSIFLVVLTTLFFVGCQNQDKTNSTPNNQLTQTVQEEEVSFRLKWLIYSSFAPHFVALEKGLYEAQDLNVTIHPGGPGLDPIKLVLSGTDTVGLASYDQILMAREKGLPIIAIAEDTVKSGVGFLSLKKSGITKPEDFIGRKVGVMLGTDKGTIYQAMMNQQKIDRKKITEVPIAFNLGLLFNGQIEVFPAFITNQPIIAKNKGFEVNIIDPYEYGIRPGGNVYFTTEKMLREKRNILKRFLTAELQGIIKSQEMSDEEVVDLVMKHNQSLDRKTEIEIWQATKVILLQKDPEKVGIMGLETWRHTATISKDYGLIKTEPALNKCYTNELVNEIRLEGKLKSKKK